MKDFLVSMACLVACVAALFVGLCLDQIGEIKNEAKQCVNRSKYTDHQAFYDMEARVCVLKFPDGRVMRETP